MHDASILITVFNCDEYIEQSVASALSQTIEDFEVIVVDDGSTDRTAQMLDRIEDRRLKTFHCPRIGRARALNFGLERCASPYVAILDADDIAFPRRLRLQADFLSNNPDIVLVGSKFRTFIDADGRLTGRENLLPTESREILVMLKAMKYPLAHSSIMFRKEAVRELGGYDENLPCYGDLDLYVRAASNFKFANIGERLSLKRLHPKQFFGGPAGLLHTPAGLKAREIVARRAAALA